MHHDHGSDHLIPVRNQSVHARLGLFQQLQTGTHMSCDDMHGVAITCSVTPILAWLLAHLFCSLQYDEPHSKMQINQQLLIQAICQISLVNLRLVHLHL